MNKSNQPTPVNSGGKETTFQSFTRWVKALEARGTIKILSFYPPDAISNETALALFALEIYYRSQPMFWISVDRRGAVLQSTMNMEGILGLNVETAGEVHELMDKSITLLRAAERIYGDALKALEGKEGDNHERPIGI